MNRNSLVWMATVLSVILPATHMVAEDKPDARLVDLVGQVVDADNHPVANANVVVIYKSWPNDRYRQQSLNAQTDENGKFALKKLYRTGEITGFLVSIVKSGLAMESQYVLNKDGLELPPFKFTLQAAQPLTVQLCDSQGKPWPEVAVAPRRRTSANGNEQLLYYQSLPSVQVTTSAEGHVDLSYFRAGDEAEFEVFAGAASDSVTFTVDANQQRRITVDITEPLDLTGSVLADDGASIPDARVLLIFKSWPNNRYQQRDLTTTTDAQGAFRFPKLYNQGQRSAFLVTILADGYAMESQYVINQDGAQQDFQFTLSAAQELTLQLVNERGQPMANAATFPSRRQTATGVEHVIYHQSGPGIARTTDADGRLVLNWFQPGDTVDLQMKHEETTSTSTFRVTDAREQTIRVASKPAQVSRRWQPEAREALPEQIGWLRRSAIQLRSVDPADEDFSDLMPLKRLIGDARIVQLGEQSHGDGTCFETKIRLIKFLHQEMGFDVLAFESGLFDCHKAWQAFQNGQSPIEAAEQGIFGIWTGSQQVQPLFHYLASQANSDKPLELCGFDCQFTARGTHQYLLHDLRQLARDLKLAAEAPVELEIVDAWLAKRAKNGAGWTYDKRIPAALDKLAEVLTQKAADSEGQQREIHFWIQNFRSMKWVATSSPNINARDAQMADNLVWLANEHFKGRKIIVWAASFHITRNASEIEVPGGTVNYDDTVPMGHHVAQQLGNDVFTMGFTAYEGTAGAWHLGKFTIEAAPDGTMEAMCNTAGLTNAIIPLRVLAAGGEWLNEKQFSRPLGYTWMRASWPRHFDAMCFNHTMTESERRREP